MMVANSTALAEEELFSQEDFSDGVLKEISEDGLVLNGDVTKMPDWGPDNSTMCEKTFLFIIVDPFGSIEDKNLTNNIVMIPIERDCSSFESMMPMCLVTPDFTTLGEQHCNWTIQVDRLIKGLSFLKVKMPFSTTISL